MWKAHRVRAILGVVFPSRAGAMDSAPLQTWAKHEGFCSSFKNHGRRGTCEQPMQKGISRGRQRHACDMLIKHVKRSESRFPERVKFGRIRSARFAKVILRGRWQTLFAAVMACLSSLLTACLMRRTHALMRSFFLSQDRSIQFPSKHAVFVFSDSTKAGAWQLRLPLSLGQFSYLPLLTVLNHEPCHLR